MRADVALVFDYAAEWGWAIQPHGAGNSYFGLVFDTYRALRRLGLSVDVIPPRAEALADRKLILAPGLLTPDPAFLAALGESDAEILLGPRFGARSADMATPVPLPPGVAGLDVTVARVESLRPGLEMPLAKGGQVTRFRDVLETGATVLETTEDGAPVLVAEGKSAYLGGWLDDAGLDRLLADACARADIPTLTLPAGVRVRDTATERFWFNYGATEAEVGGKLLPPAGVLREAR